MTGTATGGLPVAIGSYRPVRKLGQGGMGVVYEAEDTRVPGKTVALKVVSWSSESKQDDPVRRFLREARILEKLRHPNVVSFLEVGIHHDQTFFAMELLHGVPLSAYIGRPWPELAPLLIQVCYGMEYLASEAVVHRDLSPDNVFVVVRDGRPLVKILDFGIAKDTGRQETLYNFTRTGVLMGKPLYWSPELIGALDPGEKIDWRSDVYALGVIFHRVLSGAPPFQADSALSYISLHLEHDPGEMTTPAGNPPIPASFSGVVRKMMAKSRSDRPQSYAEIVDVLREAIDAAPAELREASGSFVPIRPVLLPPTRPETGGPAAREAATAGGTPDVQTEEELERPGSTPPAGTDSTVRTPGVFSPAPPDAATPATSALPGLSRRDRRRPRLFLPFVALPLLVVGLATAVWLGVRPARHRATRPEPAPAAPAGRLALHSVPWARVESVTDESDGRRVPVDAAATTPVVLELPPGRYTVELVSSAGGTRERLSVAIRSGDRTTRSVVFVDSRSSLGLLD